MKASMEEHSWLTKLANKNLQILEHRLRYKSKVVDLKNSLCNKSHSLLWVWEFSKKAVLICFIFYVIVQIYSMVVMIKYYDFTYLGDLINQTGEIVQNCVFGYLVKSGFENLGKIFIRRKDSNDDEPVG